MSLKTRPEDLDTTPREDGQQRDYLVLPAPVGGDRAAVLGALATHPGLTQAERDLGMIRPVRRTYLHSRCGTTTTMGTALAETYARRPSFYGATFCCACRGHFPVGQGGEFTWDGTDEEVGT